MIGEVDKQKRPARRRLFVVTSAAVVLALVVATVCWYGSAGRKNGGGGPPSGSVSSSLPPRVVSGYWQAWGNPRIELHEVPAQYNLIFAAFAVADGTGTGRVRFDQEVQSRASFIADVDALQRAGRRVSLSVGGAEDGGIEITSRAQVKAFLASVGKIIDLYHFTGVDWDLEHGIDRRSIADVSRQLKAQYGPQFLITMAPMQNQPDYEDLAVEIQDIIDMVNPQFYNGGQPNRRYILDEARRWAAKVGADRVGMGFMTVQADQATGVLPPSEVAATWRDVVRLLPRARGLMTWSINLDSTSGYRLASTCGPLVRGGPVAD